MDNNQYCPPARIEQPQLSVLNRVARPSSIQSLKETISNIASEIKGILAKRYTAEVDRSLDLATTLLHLLEAREEFSEYGNLLLDVCYFLFEMGRTQPGIDLAQKLRARAILANDRALQRRILSTLGGQYGDVADFAAAMRCFQEAIELARQLHDPLGEAASFANTAVIMQDMGHHRQAIRLSQRIIGFAEQTDVGAALRLQAASNGLFSAHRIGDRETASLFLNACEKELSSQTPALRRAFFERNRALYLVDEGRSEEALRHVAAAALLMAAEHNPRVKILVRLSKVICEWGCGHAQVARTLLDEQYEESRRTRLYHHFVLQTGVKVYSDPSTPEEAKMGLEYARELVEFTMSVKKAKFYRQLAQKRPANDDLNSIVERSHFYPEAFTDVSGWLSASDVVGGAGNTSPPERRELTKHEELTAIHEDIAKLRAARLRREIRTDAVGTAEDWAIAAEFFDDETGQHCYRVGHLAGMLAREIGLDETFSVQIEHAARLHDIGKIAVNELILLKPGPLDASEMAAMRLHTEVGAQILSGSDDPTLMMAVDIARHHHEWWNGAGYPKKLAGRDIPISARVCAYADVYDALTHARVYKKAWTHERALDEIVRLRGVQFDPDLIDGFIKVLDRYRADLAAEAIPGFVDMDSNALIASRKKLMDTIAAGHS